MIVIDGNRVTYETISPATGMYLVFEFDHLDEVLAYAKAVELITTNATTKRKGESDGDN